MEAKKEKKKQKVRVKKRSNRALKEAKGAVRLMWSHRAGIANTTLLAQQGSVLFLKRDYNISENSRSNQIMQTAWRPRDAGNQDPGKSFAEAGNAINLLT